MRWGTFRLIAGSPGSVEIYGIPYIVVDGSTPKQAVHFQYWQQSDGVNHPANDSYPFYPIPPQAATEPHWVGGGAPGNVDERDTDRHLLIVDRDAKHLYEPFNVFRRRAVARGLRRLLRHEHQRPPAR